MAIMLGPGRREYATPRNSTLLPSKGYVLRASESTCVKCSIIPFPGCAYEFSEHPPEKRSSRLSCFFEVFDQSGRGFWMPSLLCIL
jgi:hypothetical protein